MCSKNTTGLNATEDIKAKKDQVRRDYGLLIPVILSMAFRQTSEVIRSRKKYRRKFKWDNYHLLSFSGVKMTPIQYSGIVLTSRPFGQTIYCTVENISAFRSMLMLESTL